MPALALPATPSVASLPSVVAGVAFRRFWTSSAVDSLDGEPSGMTWKASADRSWEAPIGTTASTFQTRPSSSPMAACSATMSSSPIASGRSATTSSGPLEPSPNFSACTS